MMKFARLTLCAGLALAAFTAVPALAQSTTSSTPAQMPSMPSHDMSGMKMSPSAAGMAMPGMPGMKMSQSDADAMPSSKAFKAADEKMMRDMMGKPKSGDPDQDFVASMLPHHQGAVDMAKIQLQYGKDPAMRRLAQSIIKDQEKEIAQMTAWQKKHPIAP